MLITVSNCGLLEEIELTRQNMVSHGMEFGFTHPSTLQLSVKLDKLMNTFSMDTKSGEG
ncbi:aspartyl-phosphate phosphatase Spo0E family protein [Bacillus solitudinis]|uniref:aspartyl-phosphate phosphatase Spo0E family protein n=1 Tax=Bacillus solitudinis TaxID=2014074 RepID=UPI001D0D0E10|nr:aspartyl-phosphate phosphatase Spo0E family protein [Bacillus solitudinis]